MQRFVSPNFCPVNKQNGVRVVRYVADGCARTERKKERKKEISRSCCQRERILRTKKNDTHARATVASSLVDCTRTSSSSFARPGFLLLLLLLLLLDMMTSEQQQRKVRYFNVVLWLKVFVVLKFYLRNTMTSMMTTRRRRRRLNDSRISWSPSPLRVYSNKALKSSRIPKAVPFY